MGEQFQSTVKGLSFKGLGVVAHPNGQIFFVQGAWPGDEALFEIESIEKSYGYAKILKLLKPSDDRRPAPCSYQGFEPGKCGGCPWMIATYPSQLQQKDKILSHLLERASILTDRTSVKPIIGSPSEFGYRNRAQFKTDGQSIGFVTARSNQLAPTDDCMVLTDLNRQTLKMISSQLPRSDWKPEKYRWNLIEVDDSDPTFEINKKKNFRQGNDAQNLVMKNWLKSIVENIKEKTTVIELFSGSGNFTEVLSAVGFEQIFAYEASPDAISELNRKSLSNTKGFAANIYSSKSWNNIKKNVKSPKVLVLDPPREGFEEISSFIKLFPTIEHIIYISCDSSTFIRDVKKLRGQKFELVEIQPIDQFPQTPHIEVLSYLTLLTN